MPDKNILIIEDNPSHALSLEILLQELEYTIVATLDNSEKVIDFVNREGYPDLVLVDININGKMNGIQLADKLQGKTAIIFITSIEDGNIYNISKRVTNYGYIVKPYNKLTLQSSIENALIFFQQETLQKETSSVSNNSLFIKRRSQLEKVRFEEILYLKSDGNYSMIFTKEKKFVLKMSLVRVINALDQRIFVRIGKSNIVNINKITSINTSKGIVAINNIELPIGRSYKKEVLKKINMLK